MSKAQIWNSHIEDMLKKNLQILCTIYILFNPILCLCFMCWTQFFSIFQINLWQFYCWRKLLTCCKSLTNFFTFCHWHNKIHNFSGDMHLFCEIVNKILKNVYVKIICLTHGSINFQWIFFKWHSFYFQWSIFFEWYCFYFQWSVFLSNTVFY